MEGKTYELFKVIRSGAKNLKTKDKNADGLAFWTRIKRLLEPFDDIEIKWNPELGTEKYTRFAHQVMELPEKDATNKMIGSHHFIIQCVRIPKNDKLTIRKLGQIALNIGQLIPVMDEIPLNIIKDFIDLNMCSMKTYITDTSVFDKIITQDLITNVRHVIDTF